MVSFKINLKQGTILFDRQCGVPNTFPTHNRASKSMSLSSRHFLLFFYFSLGALRVFLVNLENKIDQTQPNSQWLLLKINKGVNAHIHTPHLSVVHLHRFFAIFPLTRVAKIQVRHPPPPKLTSSQCLLYHSEVNGDLISKYQSPRSQICKQDLILC